MRTFNLAALVAISVLVGVEAHAQGWSPKGSPTPAPAPDCSAAYNNGRQVQGDRINRHEYSQMLMF
jgi:hypothetical protein